MHSKDRLEKTFSHKEPDMIPIDFGGHLISSIHNKAYEKLLNYLGYKEKTINIERYRHRTAVIDEEILMKFNIDTQQIVPPMPNLLFTEDDIAYYYRDEWNISWKLKKDGGMYYEPFESPISELPNLDQIKEIQWPDFSKKERIKGIKNKFKSIELSGRVPIMDLPLGLEIFDLGFNLCGSSNFYMLLALDESASAYIMDKQLESQLAWWEMVIRELPNLEYVRLGDDLGSQNAMLISPEMYRKIVKPRHKRLIEGIKTFSKGKIKVIMHSDGAILPIIPDFIDIGVDCLNPIQYTINELDPAYLKKEFGDSLVFWGGGIDTQNILPRAKPQEVRDEVKKQIDILAPGGGYVFSQVHIIQPDVPPENIVAMLEAANEYRK